MARRDPCNRPKRPKLTPAKRELNLSWIKRRWELDALREASGESPCSREREWESTIEANKDSDYRASVKRLWEAMLVVYSTITMGDIEAEDIVDIVEEAKRLCKAWEDAI